MTRNNIDCIHSGAAICNVDDCSYCKGKTIPLQLYTNEEIVYGLGNMIEELAKRLKHDSSVPDPKYREQVFENNYKELVKKLEALTPGGSEFHNNPKRVLDWIKDRLNGPFVSVKTENEKLKRELLQARDVNAANIDRADKAEAKLELLCGKAKLLGWNNAIAYVISILQNDQNAGEDTDL